MAPTDLHERTDSPTATIARHRVRTPLLLGSGLVLATAVAAAGTFFLDTVLRGPDVMQGSARGTALIMLVVGVPALAIGMWRAAAGSSRGLLVWLGTCAYVPYNSVMLLFSMPFNALFLVYVAMLGLSLATLIRLLATVDVVAVARVLRRLPARSIAVYIAVLAVGNAALWLSVVVPDLNSPGLPSFLEGTGVTQNPLYVQDLAFWQPLALVAAVLLWRRRPWGYVIAGGVTVMWLIESVGVTTDQWYGSHADPSSTVATMGGAYLFAALTLIAIVPVVLLLRGSRPESG